MKVEVETFYLLVRVCSWVIVVVCFLSGLGLLVFPKTMVRLNRALNRSFSTEKLAASLEKIRDLDQWIVGKRVVTGIIALVISVVIFLLLVTS